LCSAYQLVYLAIPFLIKEKAHLTPTPHSFTILIAARNEEAVIAQLLDSIAAQDYPKDLIRVCVTADNCSDSTAEIARSKGATVFERTNKEKIGKGYVLQFMLDKLASDGIESDVYLVLDADNVIEADYVKQMNQSICDGFSIVTGYRNTKNYGDNWISAGYGLWFLRESQFVNRARHRLQTSCMVMGTGFCFTHDIAKKLGGWGYFSMTEDTDFSMDMICKGEKIGYSAVFGGHVFNSHSFQFVGKYALNTKNTGCNIVINSHFFTFKLYFLCYMPGNVAANINRNRKSCNMCWRILNINTKRRCFSAKALWTYISCINLVKNLFFQITVKRLFISFTDRSAKRFF
jgi:glycosyltransferase involved in cell wall biosynthesis